MRYLSVKDVFYKILSNEKQREKMNSLKDLNKAYDLFCESGYEKSFNDFKAEMDKFLHSDDSLKIMKNDFDELSDETLEEVAGGKGDLKQKATMGIAALMTVSSFVGPVTSVNAVGEGSSVISGRQTTTSLEEAKKRFYDLSHKIYGKVMAFLDLEEELGIEMEYSDYKMFTDVNDVKDDLYNKIYYGWDNNPLAEQIKLIDKYEDVVNKCIKVMENYKTKYEQIIMDKMGSQMSIININKETKKVKDNKPAKEELLYEKEELQKIYDEFKKTKSTWEKFNVKDYIGRDNKHYKLLLDRLNYIEKRFFKFVDESSDKINENELLKTKLTKNYIDWLERDAKLFITQAKNFMNQCITSKEAIQQDRKNRIKEQRLKYENRRKEFNEWKELNGITDKQDPNSFAYYQVEKLNDKLKTVNRYEEAHVKEYSEKVDNAIKGMDKFVEKTNGWQFVDKDKIDDYKDLNNDKNDDWEVL